MASEQKSVTQIIINPLSLSEGIAPKNGTELTYELTSHRIEW